MIETTVETMLKIFTFLSPLSTNANTVKRHLMLETISMFMSQSTIEIKTETVLLLANKTNADNVCEKKDFSFSVLNDLSNMEKNLLKVRLAALAYRKEFLW